MCHPTRRCAACNTSFQPSREWATFCSTACRTGFANRAKSEGGPLAPLVKAWNATRHAKPGTREAEICRFARSQITAIARELNEADEAAARASAIDYVGGLMDSGYQWADRRRG